MKIILFFHAKISILCLEWLRNPIKANCCQNCFQKYTQYKILLFEIWIMMMWNIFFFGNVNERWFEVLLFEIWIMTMWNIFNIFGHTLGQYIFFLCFFCFMFFSALCKYRRTNNHTLLVTNTGSKSRHYQYILLWWRIHWF